MPPQDGNNDKKLDNTAQKTLEKTREVASKLVLQNFASSPIQVTEPPNVASKVHKLVS